MNSKSTNNTNATETKVSNRDYYTYFYLEDDDRTHITFHLPVDISFCGKRTELEIINLIDEEISLHISQLSKFIQSESVSMMMERYDDHKYVMETGALFSFLGGYLDGFSRLLALSGDAREKLTTAESRADERAVDAADALFKLASDPQMTDAKTSEKITVVADSLLNPKETLDLSEVCTDFLKTNDATGGEKKVDLAVLLSAAMKHPDIPTRLYNAMADELNRTDHLDTESPKFIAHNLEYLKAQE